MELALKGLLVGVAVSAPVGPVGLMTIRQSLLYGRTIGFATGLGSAVGDVFFGAVTAFGITTVTTFLTRHHHAFQLVGGIAMLVMGLHAIWSKSSLVSVGASPSPNLWATFVSTLALTLTNPVTFLAFFGLFSALDIKPETFAAALELTLGTFLGSMLWWFLLSTLAAWMGTRLKPGFMRWINLSAGTMIAGFGCWQLLSLYLHHRS